MTDPGELTERLIRLWDALEIPSAPSHRYTLADAANFIAEAERREGEARAEIRDLLEQKLTNVDGMELPHAYFMLRAKVLSVVSCLSDPKEESDG